WEPAGRSLLARIPRREAPRAVDVGCGALGWLRVLGEWAGPNGEVVGADIDEAMLAAAGAFAQAEGLANVNLCRDDLFASALPAHSFDLVHARFQLAPLGRVAEQLHAFRRLVKPGGWLVLEEPDLASWRLNPDAPGTARLIETIGQAFLAAGGDFNAGRALPGHFRRWGVAASVDAHVVALPREHPYLRLPLQFAVSLKPRLEALVGADGARELVATAESELARPDVWGTSFTLIQAAAVIPA
ncbi:MAG TPA: methyltransferase domain-containing protein, partial [Candidatus Eisenbacteria bacterium]|nr:methyltransferase domain-containing protein [Candidatus Eisenbacteria bacterium]